MPLKVTGRHMSIHEGTKDYLDKKVERLRRLVPKIDEMSFTLSKEKLFIDIEASFKAGKIEAHAHTRAEHVNEAIDMLIDKLEGQIAKSKKKVSDKSQAARHAHRLDEKALGPDPAQQAELAAEAEEELVTDFEERKIAEG
jgi:ribosomal subunit interface protein